MIPLLLALACLAPCERPSKAWELSGVYVFAAGADELAGGYARHTLGPAFMESNGMQDFNARLGLKLALAPVYVWSANKLLRSERKSLRVAGRVLEFALPGLYLYGAVRNVMTIQGAQ